MEAACSYKTLVIYQTTRRHDARDENKYGVRFRWRLILGLNEETAADESCTGVAHFMYLGSTLGKGKGRRRIGHEGPEGE
jgi:hypothetical protein